MQFWWPNTFSKATHWSCLVSDVPFSETLKDQCWPHFTWWFTRVESFHLKKALQNTRSNAKRILVNDFHPFAPAFPRFGWDFPGAVIMDISTPWWINPDAVNRGGFVWVLESWNLQESLKTSLASSLGVNLCRRKDYLQMMGSLWITLLMLHLQTGCPSLEKRAL